MTAYYKAYQENGLDLLAKMEGKDFMVFDLETTGFDPHSCQITQIAAVMVDGGTLQKKGEPFVRLISLNAHAVSRLAIEVLTEAVQDSDSLHYVLALNGHHRYTQNEKDYLLGALTDGLITSREYQDRVTHTSRVKNKGEWPNGKAKEFQYEQPHTLTQQEFVELLADEANRATEAEALTDFFLWMRANNVTRVIGHNARLFDVPFLEVRFLCFNLYIPKLIVTDTMWLSRLLFLPAVIALFDTADRPGQIIDSLGGNREKLSSRLQDLRKALEVEGGLAHSAEGDVDTTINLLKEMCSFLKSNEHFLESSHSSYFNELKEMAFERFHKNGFKY